MALPTLDEPLDRLRLFRGRFGKNDIVDTQSGLTAGDLDMIIHQAAGTIGEVPLEDIDQVLANLPPMESSGKAS